MIATQLLLERERAEAQHLRMLDQRRGRTLAEIHFQEKELVYLRYHSRKQQEAINR